MHTALTGTPGTGKSSVGEYLERRGVATRRLSELARESNALRRFYPDRQTTEVDLTILEQSLPHEPWTVLIGHHSHRLRVDRVIVLRCHPEILRARLEARGWAPMKVQENVEAEAIGVITAEALRLKEVYEVDTSKKTQQEVTLMVLDVLEGRGERFRAPWVDWSEVILGWY